GALLAGHLSRVRHLAFSFNFTDLPAGLQRTVMTRAFRRIERFVVYSNLEKDLYARFFDLPPERFDMIHWGVQCPTVKSDVPPLEAGHYICAIGSQARDYPTLLAAMNRLRGLRLVIVANAGQLAGLEIPPNVTVHTNIPLNDAINILNYSRFMVLPLRDNVVPCGHVTIVSAMHLGKAIVATGSAGLLDYLQPGVNGYACEARDAGALAHAIRDLYESPETAVRLGRAGQLFAREYCVEERVVEYFQRFLAS
ncbi:MAG: hypothetical protein JWN94_4630, partial [Betaproteobacteria bacterium]|nr:hypothetical protein [Betaproteobacteria bacterium]